MSKDWIIWAVTLWIVVFMMAGQAVATCLLGAGILGVMLWMNPAVLNGIIGQDTFYTASTYTLSIIPLLPMRRCLSRSSRSGSAAMSVALIRR